MKGEVIILRERTTGKNYEMGQKVIFIDKEDKSDKDLMVMIFYVLHSIRPNQGK